MDDETRRYLDALRQGSTFAAGKVLLASNPATSTAVTKRGVSVSSIIHLTFTSTASGSAGTAADIKMVIPAKDMFTIMHTASTSARVVMYSFSTPVG